MILFKRIKVELIDDAHKFYTFWSMWGIVLLGMSGDLYNLAVDNHILSGTDTPAALMSFLHWAAFAAGSLRLVKQQILIRKSELEQEAQQPPTAS